MLLVNFSEQYSYSIKINFLHIYVYTVVHAPFDAWMTLI